MEIIHIPAVGIELAGRLVRWGTSRQALRQFLGAPSDGVDVVHDISRYLPGAEDIDERKDIYREYIGRAVSFTALYDREDAFREFELHEADQIQVGEIAISFKTAVPDLAVEIENKGYALTELEGSKENILINSLLTNFASARYLGGDGDLVGYVYCSESIDHLL